MKNIDQNLPCPSCKGVLRPLVMVCESCDIEVKGHFRAPEFAGLEPELMHFLRIFVHCEGRIKDMEKALGVSYPTVKATMARLKRALGMPIGDADSHAEDQPKANPASTAADRLAILTAVEKGEITYEEGLQRLKAAKTPINAKAPKGSKT